MSEWVPKPHEWSATFIRSRAEMFVASLFMLVLAAAPVQPDVIPIINLHLRHEEPILVALLYWASAAFYIYAAVSLVTRWLLERASAVDFLAPFQEATGQLDSALQKLSAADLSAQALALQNVASELKEAASLLPSHQPNEIVAEASSGLQNWESMWPTAEFSRLIDRLLAPSGKLNSEFIGREQEKLKTILVSKIADLSDIYAGSQNEFRKMLTQINHALNTYNTNVESAIAMTTTVMDEMSDLEDRQQKGPQKALEKAVDEVSKLRNSISGWRNVANFDRNAMAFVIPMVSSAAIVITSIVILFGGLGLSESSAEAQSPAPDAAVVTSVEGIDLSR